MKEGTSGRPPEDEERHVYQHDILCHLNICFSKY